MVSAMQKTGTIITGAEILSSGTMYKYVRNSGSMYMIIGVSSVDYYQITLETPLSYYEMPLPGLTGSGKSAGIFSYSYLDLFHSHPDTVAGFEQVSFRDINIEPEAPRVILGWILGHQAVFLFVDISNKINR